MVDTNARVRHLVGSPADYASNDLVIGNGEFALENDGVSYNFKIGDGVRTYSQLPYEIVTIATDQEILGEKTFTSDIVLKNQIDPASTATIYSTDFLGFHSIQMDGHEPNSSCYLIGRDPAGDPLVFSVYQNGGIYFNEHLICDTNGLHANTVARFNQQILIYQSDTDNGGDTTEYYQIEVNDANGGNRLSVETPFLDSEIVLHARDDLGADKNYRFTANGYVLQSYTSTGSDPTNALMDRNYIDEAIKAAHEVMGATPQQLLDIQAALDAL
jgi:hypothetical protein